MLISSGEFAVQVQANGALFKHCADKLRATPNRWLGTFILMCQSSANGRSVARTYEHVALLLWGRRAQRLAASRQHYAPGPRHLMLHAKWEAVVTHLTTAGEELGDDAAILAGDMNDLSISVGDGHTPVTPARLVVQHAAPAWHEHGWPPVSFPPPSPSPHRLGLAPDPPRGCPKTAMQRTSHMRC